MNTEEAKFLCNFEFDLFFEFCFECGGEEQL